MSNRFDFEYLACCYPRKSLIVRVPAFFHDSVAETILATPPPDFSNQRVVGRVIQRRFNLATSSLSNYRLFFWGVFPLNRFGGYYKNLAGIVQMLAAIIKLLGENI